MKQTIYTIAIVLIIIGLLSVIVSGSRNQKAKSDIVQSTRETSSAEIPIFFYGNTCPHCEDVEKWIKDNKIEEKIEIIKKEVYDNPQNSQELSLAAKSCGIETNSIGVPFLYAEKKCLVGAPDIESYLSQKAGL